MIRRVLAGAALATTIVVAAAAARAADAPASIRIGKVYAGSGRFASLGLTSQRGLQFWLDRVNAEGGVFVKAFGKKLPVELVSYDDQSSTSTAATFYSQLITQDKVDLLVADSGSVLTSVGIPIARDNKRLLVNQTGTGANLFSKDNPYMVAVSAPTSDAWAGVLGRFVAQDAKGLGVKRVAIIYCTNDFTTTQATTVRAAVKAAGLDIVYDNGVPTETSNYTVLINNIRAAKPDLVLNFGYTPNDIAFFRNLAESGTKFPMVFGIYPGIEFEVLEKNVGAKGLMNVMTYVPPSIFEAKPEFGLDLKAFSEGFRSKFPDIEFGFNAVAGYNTGLVIEKALGAADSLDQLELRRAFFSLSGKLKTIEGTFELGPEGQQIGLLDNIGQVVEGEHGHLALKSVYPPEVADAKVVYPRP